MTAKFHFDVARDILIGRISDVALDGEIIEAIGDVVTESQGAVLKKDILLIVDEGTKLHWIDMAALLRIKDAIESWVRIYPGRDVHTALVAHSSFGNTLLRLWQSLTELYPDLGVHARVFDRESLALDWLKGCEK